MAGQFPTSVEFSYVSVISKENNLSSRSQSQVRQSRLIGAHVWVLSVKFNLMTKKEFAPVWAFLNNQKGSHESFTIILPGYDQPLGINNGSPIFSTKITDNRISVNNYTPSITDQVYYSDMFNIGGDSKVYAAANSASSDSSGNLSIDFTPALRKTPGPSAPLTFSNVVFTVSLDNDVQFNRNGLLFQISPLTMTEALI
ncbi:MAG: hypothetical protein JKX76_04325 [Colwellia sp.]|nr:hypothetical protein [Colwellia sp.]